MIDDDFDAKTKSKQLNNKTIVLIKKNIIEFEKGWLSIIAHLPKNYRLRFYLFNCFTLILFY